MNNQLKEGGVSTENGYNRLYQRRGLHHHFSLEFFLLTTILQPLDDSL